AIVAAEIRRDAHAFGRLDDIGRMAGIADRHFSGTGSDRLIADENSVRQRLGHGKTIAGNRLFLSQGGWYCEKSCYESKKAECVHGQSPCVPNRILVDKSAS